MITIVSALKSEIAPLLQRVPVNEKRILAGGSLYISERIHFLRTGIGSRKTREVCTLYLNRFRPGEIINIGFSGKLDASLSIGQIYPVSTFQAEGKSPIAPAAGKPVPGVSLLSVEKAVTSTRVRDKLHRESGAGIVDMEAYYLAEICAENGTPFSCFKIISDDADQNTGQVFLENYKTLAQELAFFIWENKLKNLS